MKQFDSEHLNHIINSSIVSNLFFGPPIFCVLTNKLPKGKSITFLLLTPKILMIVLFLVILIRETIQW